MQFSISRPARYLFTAICALFFSFNLNAQAAEYKAHNEGWLVSLDEAYALSKETGRPILANFTGSDWCGWCRKLTASVFVHDEFKTWAADNVILLELDFPRRSQLPEDIKTQNYSLARSFKVTGYPTIWVFDLERGDDSQYAITALGKTGYTATAEKFIESIEQMIANRTE